MQFLSACASGRPSSFFSVLFSIWRIRSRVTPNARPTSSSVHGCVPERPKRSSITLRSRSGSAEQRELDVLAPERERGGVERRLGRVVRDEVAERALLLLADRLLERDRQLRHPEDLADLLGRHLELLGDLVRAAARGPRRWTSWRSMWTTLFSFSTMCTGIRIVRALSAIARVTAWRIHQVA